MPSVKVTCTRCGTSVHRPRKEVRRSERLGRRFFCSGSCAARAGNETRQASPVTVVCPRCDTGFTSSTKRRAPKYCSRSCASAASYKTSQKRQEASRKSGHQNRRNLLTPEETLKRREAKKYVHLNESLVQAERSYEFEYALDGKVFDLALFDTKVLVEFDSPYHNSTSQRARDSNKEKIAERNGFLLVRRQVLYNEVIDPRRIAGL